MMTKKPFQHSDSLCSLPSFSLSSVSPLSPSHTLTSRPVFSSCSRTPLSSLSATHSSSPFSHLSPPQIIKYFKWFTALSKSKTGTVEIEHLSNVFLSTQLIKNKREFFVMCRELVPTYDSGLISFEDFLEVLNVNVMMRKIQIQKLDTLIDSETSLSPDTMVSAERRKLLMEHVVERSALRGYGMDQLIQNEYRSRLYRNGTTTNLHNPIHRKHHTFDELSKLHEKQKQEASEVIWELSDGLKRERDILHTLDCKRREHKYRSQNSLRYSRSSIPQIVPLDELVTHSKLLELIQQDNLCEQLLENRVPSTARSDGDETQYFDDESEGSPSSLLKIIADARGDQTDICQEALDSPRQYCADNEEMIRETTEMYWIQAISRTCSENRSSSPPSASSPPPSSIVSLAPVLNSPRDPASLFSTPLKEPSSVRKEFCSTPVSKPRPSPSSSLSHLRDRTPTSLRKSQSHSTFTIPPLSSPSQPVVYPLTSRPLNSSRYSPPSFEEFFPTTSPSPRRHIIKANDDNSSEIIVTPLESMCGIHPNEQLTKVGVHLNGSGPIFRRQLTFDRPSTLSHPTLTNPETEKILCTPFSIRQLSPVQFPQRISRPSTSESGRRGSKYSPSRRRFDGDEN